MPKAEELIVFEERSVASQQRLNVQRWARALAETWGALLPTFAVVLLALVAAEQFPQSASRSCFLSLYRGDHPSLRALAHGPGLGAEGRASGPHRSRSFASGSWLGRDPSLDAATRS